MSDQEWQEKTHEQRLAVRAALDDKYFKSATEFSKTIITLSAGTLALSMALMTDLLKNPQGLGWLKLSWASFGVTILLVVASSHFEALSLRRQIDITDDYYERVIAVKGRTRIEPETNKWMKPALQAGYWSIATFVAGYFFLAGFVLQNL